MADEGFNDPVYLYFGQIEWDLRPGLRDLRTPEKAPPELDLVIQGSKGPWALYRYVGTRPLQAESGQTCSLPPTRTPVEPHLSPD